MQSLGPESIIYTRCPTCGIKNRPTRVVMKTTRTAKAIAIGLCLIGYVFNILISFACSIIPKAL